MSRSLALGRLRGDDGAYAILYAVTMVLFIAFAGIVVDISSARADRRVNRMAADAAALGAATQLRSDIRNPHAACQKAVAYLNDNTPGFSASASAACTPFLPYASGSWSCPPSPIAFTPFASGRFELTMTWPVIDGSSLLKFPDVRPASPPAEQPADSDFDGTDPCQRFAVTVLQKRDFLFGPAIGGPAGTATAVSSVARAGPQGESGDAAVALLVLERTNCLAIDIQGSSGAAIRVRGSGDRPGMIHADSIGSGPLCTGTDKVVDGDFGSVSDPLNPPRVWAEDAETGTPLAPGAIGIRALNGDAGAVPTNAHDPSPNTVYAEGQPSGAPEGRPLLGRGAVDGRYRTAVKDSVSTARSLWSMSAASAASAGYTVLGCAPPATPVTDTRVFVDCAGGITYTAPFAFSGAGAVVVFNGPVTVGGGPTTTLSFPNASAVYVKGSATQGLTLTRRLKINTGGQPTCADRLTTDRSTRAKLVVGDGPFAGAGNADVQLCQTSVILAGEASDSLCPVPTANGVAPYDNACDGFFDLRGSGGLDWTAPNTQSTASGPADWAELEDLALWTETSTPNTSPDQANRVEGGGVIKMAGVFFLPNANPFRIAGGGDQDIGENAQFIARRLQVAGNGRLIMRPDPDDVVLFPYFGGITLIR